MIWNRKNIVGIVLLAVLVTSCGQYHKTLKSDDFSLKYQMAEALYKKKDYSRADRLFEQIVPHYLGKPQGERILYMYADGLYQRKRYVLARHQFEKFVKNYPKSEKAPEAAFLEAKSYFLDVPRYSLEQSETYIAVDKLQDFIDRYPESEYIREANNMMMELLTNLQRKSFEIAKGYNKIRDYQAAIKSLDNFLIENPGSTFKEEAMYLRLHSAFHLAENSVKSKEKQRFEQAKSAYENLLKNFPETHFKEKADKMYQEINQKLKQL